MSRAILLLLSIVLLSLPEILSVYFIMPIGGSQELDAVLWAYFFYHYIWLFRLLFGGLFIYLCKAYWTEAKRYFAKSMSVFLLMAYFFIAYQTTFEMRADKIFYQPKVKALVKPTNNKIDLGKLIIGVHVNGKAHAYPIQFIGYHHQVVDTVGGVPLIVTYCTVCRTGRVFSALVNGQNEEFRLVGMSNYNAMFEDKTTKSWWQQATGKAILGPLKGTQLEEIPCQQVSLQTWLNEYPQSLILQPDPQFNQEYTYMGNYENGNKKGRLTRLDTASWKPKSWVVGIQCGDAARAYDWNALKKERLIHNELNNTPLLIVLGQDHKSFRAWNCMVGNIPLQFVSNDSTSFLFDQKTQSIWNEHGECIEGELMGAQLENIQAYQEYWHSWQEFHPNTSQYPN